MAKDGNPDLPTLNRAKLEPKWPTSSTKASRITNGCDGKDTTKTWTHGLSV